MAKLRFWRQERYQLIALFLHGILWQTKYTTKPTCLPPASNVTQTSALIGYTAHFADAVATWKQSIDRKKLREASTWSMVKFVNPWRPEEELVEGTPAQRKISVTPIHFSSWISWFQIQKL